MARRSHLFKRVVAAAARLSGMTPTIRVISAAATALSLATVAAVGAQQRPDFSGGWVASKEAPEGVTAALAAPFGARFWIDQKGDVITMIRPVRDTARFTIHKGDGAQITTRTPAAMCLGESSSTTSMVWEGNNLVHRIHFTTPAGSTTPIPTTEVNRHVFKRISADKIQVEAMMKIGRPEPDLVGMIYTRTTDPPPPPPPAPLDVKTAPATLARLTWLAGNWVGMQGTSSVEERWTPANGGAMFATSRTVGSTGGVTAFEFLCVAERGGSLVYTAMPNGRAPATDFALTAIDGTSATFENPTHDFPKAIRYAVQPDGSLQATISGAPGQRATTFTFKKQ